LEELVLVFDMHGIFYELISALLDALMVIFLIIEICVKPRYK